MTDNQEEEFDRISRLPPYVFAEVNKLKAEERAAGNDIIDLGMGNPDSPTPQHIVDKLVETVSNPRTHGYSVSRGISGLRKALVSYYDRRFGVDLDPESEAIVTIGSKEGLANLSSAITKPGDIVLVPTPNYPIHTYGFVIAGASVHYISSESEQELIDDLKKAVETCNPKPRALILNFPSNPTSKTVSLDFYEEVVDFCREHGVYILSDLAYCEIYFGDTPPPSILQTKHGKEIAVEFTSVSKTYSMAGWRIGFAAGNKKLIHALTRIKSYLDYGAFTPIQVAAAAALNGPQDCVQEFRDLYKERRDIVIEGLAEVGWEIEPPDATMFIWAPLPEQYKHLGSMEFSKLLLKEAKVAVAPGIGFGDAGDGYVRIGLVENKHRIRQAVRNIKKLLKSTEKKKSAKVAG